MLPIEKGKELELRYNEGKNRKASLRKLDFDCLQGIPVLYPPETDSIDSDFWANLQKHEIVILRGFTTDLWPLQNSLFTLETLSTAHSTTPCQVWKQTSEPECCANQVLLGSLASHTLQTFLESRCLSSEGEADSATGVEIGEWRREVEELRRVLPQELLFASDLDILRYAKCSLPGLSMPQVTIRSAGGWKGACVETFRRVLLNHGPGSIEIWAVEASSTQKLLKTFKSHLKIDLLTCEKYLWPDENYLMSQKCTVLTGEVLSGDLVVLQAGLLHWEKSTEGEVSSVWGLLGREVRALKLVFERNEANRIDKRKGLAPIYDLSRSLLAAEGENLPLDVAFYLISKLKDRLSREEELISQLPLQSTGSAQCLLCSLCQQELFYAYIVCPQCPLSQFCPFCLQGHNSTHRTVAACTLFQKEEINQLCKRLKKPKSGKSPVKSEEIEAKPEKQAKTQTAIENPQALEGALSGFETIKPAKHVRFSVSRPVLPHKQAKTSTPLLPPAPDSSSEAGDTLQVDSLGDTTVFTESTVKGIRRYALSKVQMQRMVQNTKL